MKKILSLILCLLMIVPMLASCSSDEGEEQTVKTSARNAVTLGMYVITEEETTPDAAQAVEDAINAIIKSRYTTKVDIVFLTEDEYYQTVEARLEAMKETGALPVETEAVTGDEEAEDTVIADETFVNEYGVTEIKYPSLGASQIDILMLTDFSKYVKYVDNGWLYSLTNALSNEGRKLGDYIYPSILDSAKVRGAVYAIPNNRPIGDECEYMIIDKELAKEFGLKADKVSGIADLKEFLAWVKENKAGVTPINGDVDLLDLAGVTYMGYDSLKRDLVDEFSLVGALGDTATNVESLFANETYKNKLLSAAEVYYGGYFGNSAKFAVSVKTGTIEDMAKDAEKYEIVALRAGAEPARELCSSAFAVSRYTKNFSRVMEVITLINTDEEVRNLLQYGIENVNYDIDELTGELSRLNNTYMMDLYKTGNVYMAHPEEGMPLNIWEMAKKQNLVTEAYDKFLGYEVPQLAASTAVDFVPAEKLEKANKELSAALNGAKTYDAFKAIVDGAAEKYADVVAAYLDTSIDNTLFALYMSATH